MEVPGTAHSQQENAGAYTKRKFAILPQTATAAAGTGTFLDGNAINRVDPNVALSAIPAIPARLTLASGHDCSFALVVQHRTDSTDSWTDYLPSGTVTVVANNAGGTIDLDVADPQGATLGAGASVTGDPWSIDLSGAKQEIRIRVKPDFSASGVDTCAIAASVVLAGFDTNPPGY